VDSVENKKSRHFTPEAVLFKDETFKGAQVQSQRWYIINVEEADVVTVKRKLIKQ
jgi:hypothetical protein